MKKKKNGHTFVNLRVVHCTMYVQLELQHYTYFSTLLLAIQIFGGYGAVRTVRLTVSLQFNLKSKILTEDG